MDKYSRGLTAGLGRPITESRKDSLGMKQSDRMQWRIQDFAEGVAR